MDEALFKEKYAVVNAKFSRQINVLERARETELHQLEAQYRAFQQQMSRSENILKQGKLKQWKKYNSLGYLRLLLFYR